MTNDNYAAPPRTFTEAIMVCFAKYATFRGRASRSEFWWFKFFILLLVTGGMAVDCYVLGHCLHIKDYTSRWLGWLCFLAVALPEFAVGVRRLHDIGRSGWWQLLEVPAWLMAFFPIFFWESYKLYSPLSRFTDIIVIPLIIMWCWRSKTNPAT